MDLKEIEAIVKEIVSDAKITKIEFLGSDIFVYTDKPEIFYNNEAHISKIAASLKKRVNIRADPKVLLDLQEAKKIINELIPKEAGISAVFFDSVFSEVIIEAVKPGLVIGKGGSTSKAIIEKTKWTPHILRSPTIASKVISEIRNIVYKDSKERKAFLKEIAKNIFDEDSKKECSWARIGFFGAFREVGRSCILLQTPNSNVLLDCGINPARTDSRQYPMLEALGFPITELTAVVLSHAHLDHSGFVPFLYKMGFRGPLYCTSATRDIMYTLQKDYLDVLQREGKDLPYTEKDIKEMLRHTITREFGEVTDISKDIRMTFYNSSHILGSAVTHLHIGDGMHNLVYTGDYKFGFTRLFNAPSLNYPRLETLITESTYGSSKDIMPKRNEAEQLLIDTINKVVEKNGTVLIPVFAVGRSQEVMLVLESYFRKNQLKAKKVYIEGLIKEINAIHTVYPESLRDNVQSRILSNRCPFTSDLFEVVEDKSLRDDIVSSGANIVLATSGMLAGGPALDYFYRIAEDKNSAVIFVGWQGEGSLGRRLQNGEKEIVVPSSNGKLKRIKVNCEIHSIEGFSGHSDRLQLLAYIRNLPYKPRQVIVGHGESSKTLEFARTVSNKFGIKAVAPQILEYIRLF